MRNILKKISLIAGIGLIIFGSLAAYGSSDDLIYSHCWPYAFGMTPDPKALCSSAYGWFITGVIFVIGGGALIFTSRFSG